MHGACHLRYLGVAAMLAVACPATAPGEAPTDASPPVQAELQSLTGRELLKGYRLTGTKLYGTPYEPGRWPPLSAPVFSGDTAATLEAFGAYRREIVRRGGRMTRPLMRFLRKELGRSRTARSPDGLARLNDDLVDHSGPSFVSDLIALMAAIGDPKPAPLLLRIAEGYDGQARPSHRRAAMAGLQRLTYMSLRPMGAYDGGLRKMIEHPLAAELRYAKDAFERQLAFFQQWLAGEGKEPDDWLPMARRRARVLLESDEPADVYRAAQFLCPLDHDPLRGGLYLTGHDDQPERTMDRIAEVMSVFGMRDVNFVRRRNPGEVVPGDRGHWVQLLTSYGTRARRHARLIIDCRLHNQQFLDVGGDEILDYLFEHLEHATRTEQWPRTIIDRWAGRTFASDDERRAWWQANRGRTDEQRLRDSLPTLATQADSRNAFANRIVEVVLPDAPPYYVKDSEGRFQPGRSRVQWLEQHAASLRYDVVRGVFRVAPNGGE